MEYIATVAARGIAIGKVFQYTPYIPQINCMPISEEDCTAEAQKYGVAQLRAEKELHLLVAKLSAQNPKQAEIFQAHLDILKDETMDEEILEAIKSQMSANRAIDAVYTQYAEILNTAKDALISERTADILDVRLRLLRCLDGVEEKSLSELEEPVVLVTYDLMPSDTARLDAKFVQAIVTEVGGTTSHSAIIARSYGIPALTGIANVNNLLHSGDLVVIDALDGVLITDVTEEQRRAYGQKCASFAHQLREESQYRGAEPIMRDGTRIQVLANVGAADERELECAAFVDGIGLFRTEFLYMGRESLPSEEEQFDSYRKVLSAFGAKPVTIRTLDIGGDKKAACLDLPKEDNPFLGNRALRLCFEREDIFLTQLRALLRASLYGNLKLMFPMVGGMEDIRGAKKLLEKAKEELASRGLKWNPTMQVGAMIEIPSLAIMADLLAKEVDFASIGTNDLTQYTLAADRMNPAVSKYYHSLDPAVLRLIAHVSKEFRSAGKSLSVCGEMGGDPIAAAALLSLGLSHLSMGASSVAAIKKLICTVDIGKLHSCADKILGLDTAEAIQVFIQSYMQ